MDLANKMGSLNEENIGMVRAWVKVIGNLKCVVLTLERAKIAVPLVPQF